MESSKQAGISFARRLYGPRTAGCALSFIYIAMVIWPAAPANWVWGWMLVNGFVWPAFARWLALRSEHPYQVELRNLMLDSVFAGGWVAVMHFNVLPSVLLLSMVSMNNVAAKGLLFMLQGFAAQIAGALLMGLLIGFAFEPYSRNEVIWACLPMLIIYPLSVGWTSHALAVRLFQHRKAFRIINSFDEQDRLLSYDDWMSALAEDFRRCKRSNGFSTLAVLRIDDFASLYQEHGYLAAQAVSARLGQLLKAEVRSGDQLGHSGLDEYLVVFPNTREGVAQAVLDRIRDRFCHFGERAEELPDVSLSMGLVEFNYLHSSERIWLDSARAGVQPSRSGGRPVRAKLRLAMQGSQ
ncbi:MAG: putative diguanylate cyclase DgcC [Stenotrophomonas maltophilia]|nr:MAG: putative diguanylate cyclase DgcC [Stenotrophomonas maltophilia]